MTDTTTVSAHTDRAADERAITALLADTYDAWRAGDADAFVRHYDEDATAILPGSLRGSREVIRESMAAAFAGPLRGSSTLDEPISVRFLGADAAVVISRTGVLLAGQTEVPQDQLVNATWVFHRDGQGWRIAAYHNSPVQL